MIDNTAYEAELKIKLYRPDGSTYWDTHTGHITSATVEDHEYKETDSYGNVIGRPKIFMKRIFTFETPEEII